ncbi:MAG: two-component sensor histidine kinase [Hyphomicrobiales bacterium]|nr:two-component sensor histidine kinase [Hyphomicrobiales bacterium]
MSAIDHPLIARPRRVWRRFTLWLRGKMPKGLFARALLIVVVPMLLLQTAIAYFFMERHWQAVTHRLSAMVIEDVAALIDIYENYPQDKDGEKLASVAERMGLTAMIAPKGPLPPALPKPFFSLLDSALSEEIRRQIGRPFWIDTVGNSNVIEIRIQMKDAQLRVFAQRAQAYAPNTAIFLTWMVGLALALIGVAVLYLRNQIKPIRRLAVASEAFGKGREIAYRPSGAREVRQAGLAFLEMKRRVERAMEQRTAMLSGVSHDLRTVLTRFKLSLALIGEGPEQEAMSRDIGEMQRMLDAYLAFARGDGGEAASEIDMRALLADLVSDAERHGHATKLDYRGETRATVRPDAFKRCLANLIVNAQRYGKTVAISAERGEKLLVVHVDDDGPGIPAESREDAFRPFYRLDEARNQDEAGTGLGLAIARDIARAHGGDVTLSDSPLGGLRATVTVPV